MHRRLPRAQRRVQLIEVATAKFGERGFFPTGMDDIAEAAGITKPVLYQHFSSKEDLYLAVITHIGERIENAIDALKDDSSDAHSRVHAGINVFFDLMSDHASTVRLFFGTEFVSEKVQAQVSTVVDRAARSAARVVAHVRDLDEQQALVIGHVFTASVQAAAKHAIDAGEQDRQQILDTLATFLSDGINAFHAAGHTQVKGA